MSESRHIAVMTREAMDAIHPKAGGRYLDATLGGGTHTAELLERSSPDGRVLSLDLDLTALKRGIDRFESYGDRWVGVEANFRHLADVLRSRDFAPVDGVLIDLGLSSDELEDPTKGISFKVDGPLDMRLGPQANEDGLTAAQIVNSWREEEIANILSEFGEERFAYRIAVAIVKARKREKIFRTTELANIVRAAVPGGYERGRIDPATRTFQALRIAVNDELGALKDALQGACEILKPDGVIAVISFHSLEDRVVKQVFRDVEDLEVLTKKPLVPSEEECKNNPRARSAKLRAAKKILKDPNQNQTYAKRVRPIYDQPT